MKREKPRSKLVFDDSPPSEAGKKVEAAILAMRAVPHGVKLVINSAVNRAVQVALREERQRNAKFGKLRIDVSPANAARQAAESELREFRKLKQKQKRAV